MQLHWQRNEHDHSINSFDERGIQVQEKFYTGSLLLSAANFIDNWPIKHIDEVDLESLTPLLATQPEVLLLGTGDSQIFPDMSLFQAVLARGIGLEVMSTQAACRTFNVLLSEDRQVAAALVVN